MPPADRPPLRALLCDDAGVLSVAEPGLLDVVRRLRAAGTRTALVSNGDGPAPYGDLFEVSVLAGVDGVRKPDPRAFLLAAERLGVEPRACVVVDDTPACVRAAAGLGMVGVQHRSVAATAAELDVLLGAAG